MNAQSATRNMILCQDIGATLVVDAMIPPEDADAWDAVDRAIYIAVRHTTREALHQGVNLLQCCENDQLGTVPMERTP